MVGLLVLCYILLIQLNKPRLMRQEQVSLLIISILCCIITVLIWIHISHMLSMLFVVIYGIRLYDMYIH